MNISPVCLASKSNYCPQIKAIKYQQKFDTSSVHFTGNNGKALLGALLALPLLSGCHSSKPAVEAIKTIGPNIPAIARPMMPTDYYFTAEGSAALERIWGPYKQLNEQMMSQGHDLVVYAGKKIPVGPVQSTLREAKSECAATTVFIKNNGNIEKVKIENPVVIPMGISTGDKLNSGLVVDFNCATDRGFLPSDSYTLESYGPGKLKSASTSN